MKFIVFSLVYLVCFIGLGQSNLSVIHTSDEGIDIGYNDFIVGGEDIYGLGTDYNNWWVTCFSSTDLSVKWARKFQDDQHSINPGQLIQTENGLVALFVIETAGGSAGYGVLVALDFQGNEIWNHRIDLDAETDRSFNLSATSDNVIVVTWMSYHRLNCAGFDLTGDLLFKKSFTAILGRGQQTGFAEDENGYKFLLSVAPLNYIIGNIYKLDQNFNLVWSKTIEGTNNSLNLRPGSFMDWIEGKLVIAASYDVDIDYRQPAVLKLDTSDTIAQIKIFEIGSVLVPKRWYFDSENNELSCFGRVTIGENDLNPFFNHFSIDLGTLNQVSGFKYLADSCDANRNCDIDEAFSGQRLNNGFLSSTQMVSDWNVGGYRELSKVLTIQNEDYNYCFKEKVFDNSSMTTWTQNLIIEDNEEVQVAMDSISFEPLVITYADEVVSTEFCDLVYIDDVTKEEGVWFRVVDHTLLFPSDRLRTFNIKLFDLQGRIVEHFEGDVKGQYTLKANKPRGLYILEVKENGVVIYKEKIINF